MASPGLFLSLVESGREVMRASRAREAVSCWLFLYLWMSAREVMRASGPGRRDQPQDAGILWASCGRFPFLWVSCRSSLGQCAGPSTHGRSPPQPPPHPSCNSFPAPTQPSTKQPPNPCTRMQPLPLKKLRFFGGKLGAELEEQLGCSTAGEVRREGMGELCFALFALLGRAAGLQHGWGG